MDDDTTGQDTNTSNPTNTTNENTLTKQKKSNSSLVALLVITVVALILAGFFYVNAKNTQETQQAQKEAIESTVNEVGEQIEAEQQQQQEQQRQQAQEDIAQTVDRAQELASLVAAQKEIIEAANQELNTSAEAKKTTCQTLLVTMPPEDVVDFRGAWWEKDILKFYNDIIVAYKQAQDADDSEQQDKLEQDEAVTEPYATNFETNCSDIYDEATSTII